MTTSAATRVPALNDLDDGTARDETLVGDPWLDDAAEVTQVSLRPREIAEQLKQAGPEPIEKTAPRPPISSVRPVAQPARPSTRPAPQAKPPVAKAAQAKAPIAKAPQAKPPVAKAAQAKAPVAKAAISKPAPPRPSAKPQSIPRPVALPPPLPTLPTLPTLPNVDADADDVDDDAICTVIAPTATLAATAPSAPGPAAAASLTDEDDVAFVEAMKRMSAGPGAQLARATITVGLFVVFVARAAGTALLTRLSTYWARASKMAERRAPQR